ncbi:MAG: MMPL family transporter [Acidobacteriota bacterium]
MRPLDDRLAERITDLVQRRPWLVIIGVLLVVGFLASGARFLVFANDYRIFFGEDNPELVAFEEFQETYTKNDNILFVIHAEGDRIFRPQTLQAIERLTEKAWTIPHAIRVDSVTNFQHGRAEGDDLIVDDLVRDGASLSEEEAQEREATALAEPLIAGRLLSLDGDTTGINVTLQYPQESIEEVPESVAAARIMAAEIREQHPELTIVLSGVSMLNNAFTEAGQADAFFLVPLMYGVMLIVMVVTLRSWSGTIATLVVIASSAASAMGAAGWLGIGLTPIALTAPTIITTLAIADSVHVLLTLRAQLEKGKSKAEAIEASLRVNLLPVTITSITTIIGFGSLNFSDAPPFRDLGNITALGIAGAWLLSLGLLPALITVLPMKTRGLSQGGRGERASRALADFVIARHRILLPLTGLACLGLTALVPTLELNDQFVKYFDDRIEFRRDTDFTIEQLSGIYLVEWSVGSGEPGGIAEPKYLHDLEAFTQWLRDQSIVDHVFSQVDIIKKLNKNLHADDPAQYRLPEERELAAQYLLLYELSLPYGLDLNDRINVDKSATRVTATLSNETTVSTREFLEASTAWLEANVPPHAQARPTSASVMFAYISQRNIESMLLGNAVAIVLISIITCLAFRSVTIGALSLLPNALPILATFGIWALLVGEVGMASATVSSTSLGIIVDDTVHFLTKYLFARRREGLSRPDAVRFAFTTVGRAIATTTLILACGFLVLASSAFRINSQLGLLTAIAIVVALVADALLLPSLLLFGHRAETEGDS